MISALDRKRKQGYGKLMKNPVTAISVAVVNVVILLVVVVGLVVVGIGRSVTGQPA